MKNLRNYVWTLPTLLIVLVMILVSCTGSNEVHGNPAKTMWTVKQSISAIWVTLSVGFSVMVVLALCFWYVVNDLKRKFNKHLGVNV